LLTFNLNVLFDFQSNSESIFSYSIFGTSFPII